MPLIEYTSHTHPDSYFAHLLLQLIYMYEARETAMPTTTTTTIWTNLQRERHLVEVALDMILETVGIVHRVVWLLRHIGLCRRKAAIESITVSVLVGIRIVIACACAYIRTCVYIHECECTCTYLMCVHTHTSLSLSLFFFPSLSLFFSLSLCLRVCVSSIAKACN